jgi:predicted secreted protein
MRSLLVSGLLLLTSAFALVAIPGCAADADDGSGPASEDELRSLTIKESDSGRTFTVEKGGSVKVSLGSNPTTGYKWKVVSTTRTFGYPEPKEGVYQGSPAASIGSGGQQIFTWQTNSPLLQPSTTAHAIKIEYRRSFESDDTPAEKTFTVKIKVKRGTEQPPAPAGRPITINEDHEGSTIRAKEGQDLVLKLAENPSAGYRWYVESVDRTIGQPEKTFDGPGRNGPVGAGGTAVFTWKTAGGPSKVGSHAIKLKYSRGESGDASKRFAFTLNVVANADEDPAEQTCPPENRRTINCMPPTTNQYCKPDYRSWAQENCDVSYLD